MREREAPAIITATEQKGQRGGLENPSPMREPCHYPVSNRLAAPAPLHLPIKLGGWRKGGRVGGGGRGLPSRSVFLKLGVSLTFLILPILMSIHFFWGQVLRDQFCVSKYSTYFILLKHKTQKPSFVGSLLFV